MRVRRFRLRGIPEMFFSLHLQFRHFGERSSFVFHRSSGRDYRYGDAPRSLTAARVQGKVRFDLQIVDGLVSVTQRTWGLGLRVDERASGE